MDLGFRVWGYVEFMKNLQSGLYGLSCYIRQRSQGVGACRV